MPRYRIPEREIRCANCGKISIRRKRKDPDSYAREFCNIPCMAAFGRRMAAKVPRRKRKVVVLTKEQKEEERKQEFLDALEPGLFEIACKDYMNKPQFRFRV